MKLFKTILNIDSNKFLSYIFSCPPPSFFTKRNIENKCFKCVHFRAIAASRSTNEKDKSPVMKRRRVVQKEVDTPVSNNDVKNDGRSSRSSGGTVSPAPETSRCGRSAKRENFQHVEKEETKELLMKDSSPTPKLRGKSSEETLTPKLKEKVGGSTVENDDRFSTRVSRSNTERCKQSADNRAKYATDDEVTARKNQNTEEKGKRKSTIKKECSATTDKKESMTAIRSSSSSLCSALSTPASIKQVEPKETRKTDSKILNRDSKCVVSEGKAKAITRKVRTQNSDSKQELIKELSSQSEKNNSSLIEKSKTSRPSTRKSTQDRFSQNDTSDNLEKNKIEKGDSNIKIDIKNESPVDTQDLKEVNEKVIPKKLTTDMKRKRKQNLKFNLLEEQPSKKLKPEETINLKEDSSIIIKESSPLDNSIESDKLNIKTEILEIGLKIVDANFVSENVLSFSSAEEEVASVESEYVIQEKSRASNPKTLKNCHGDPEMPDEKLKDKSCNLTSIHEDSEMVEESTKDCPSQIVETSSVSTPQEGSAVTTDYVVEDIGTEMKNIKFSSNEDDAPQLVINESNDDEDEENDFGKDYVDNLPSKTDECSEKIVMAPLDIPVTDQENMVESEHDKNNTGNYTELSESKEEVYVETNEEKTREKLKHKACADQKEILLTEGEIKEEVIEEPIASEVDDFEVVAEWTAFSECSVDARFLSANVTDSESQNIYKDKRTDSHSLSNKSLDCPSSNQTLTKTDGPTSLLYASTMLKEPNISSSAMSTDLGNKFIGTSEARTRLTPKLTNVNPSFFGITDKNQDHIVHSPSLPSPREENNISISSTSNVSVEEGQQAAFVVDSAITAASTIPVDMISMPTSVKFDETKLNAMVRSTPIPAQSDQSASMTSTSLPLVTTNPPVSISYASSLQDNASVASNSSSIESSVIITTVPKGVLPTRAPNQVSLLNTSKDFNKDSTQSVSILNSSILSSREERPKSPPVSVRASSSDISSLYTIVENVALINSEQPNTKKGITLSKSKGLNVPSNVIRTLKSVSSQITKTSDPNSSGSDKEEEISPPDSAIPSEEDAFIVYPDKVIRPKHRCSKFLKSVFKIYMYTFC